MLSYPWIMTEVCHFDRVWVTSYFLCLSCIWMMIGYTGYFWSLQGWEAGSQHSLIHGEGGLTEAHRLLSHEPLRRWTSWPREAKEPEGSCQEGCWRWRRWGGRRVKSTSSELLDKGNMVFLFSFWILFTLFKICYNLLGTYACHRGFFVSTFFCYWINLLPI